MTQSRSLITATTFAVAGLSAATLIGSAALAQDDVLRRSQDGSELRTDWLLGASVMTPDGDSVGSIDALLLDHEEGDVTAAIISVGGFLGFGSKQIAVDWEWLEIAYDGNEIALPITIEQAEEAPAFEFRDREMPPPPEPAGGGTGTGMGTTGGTTGGTGLQ